MSLSQTGIDRMRTVRVMAVGLRAALTALLVTGCAAPVRHAAVVGSEQPQNGASDSLSEFVSAVPVLDLRALPELAGIIPRLAKKHVVFVGETHDQFGHHLTQLEIIRQLHERHPELAIGMEAFQQPFQSVLDDYVTGKLGERALLRKSEYFSRWQMDYRLYAPILRYAREHRLPVIALNLPKEVTGKVAREGFDTLTESEQAQLPAKIDRSDKAYEQRLKRIFDQHPDSGRGFDAFLDVQLLWDEGMAERAADYLDAHPGYRMVILAGNGHLAWGSGIPRRLMRRLPAMDSAIVLNGWAGDLHPDMADFILLTEPRALPPSGKLGAFLESDNAVPTVENCMPDSPCSRAGLKPGDRLLSVDGEPLDDMTDLRLVMWDKLPGDTVILRVSRDSASTAPEELSYTIELR